YEFAMARAAVEKEFTVKGFENVAAGIVKWPMSVIRLSGKDTDSIIALADRILEKWRGYSDEECFIFAETDGEPHNTITPIARKRGDDFELDLVLRNNITTPEHPLGVFHPHAGLHHIKKENIGLIEVMGLAVLPARLKRELALLGDFLVKRQSPYSSKELEKHAPWCDEILDKYPQITPDNVDEILKYEVGQVFAGVLEDAGVYKCTPEGREGFVRFLDSVNKT
ncbi:MAG: galactose-1-phosphate uridylyltransferase, partial [Clostridia bacterium]|nr:galactose-1-phosphate uridylyltransferase [Clostridia bacterium]